MDYLRTLRYGVALSVVAFVLAIATCAFAQDTPQGLANELRALADRVAALAPSPPPPPTEMIVEAGGNVNAAVTAAAPGTIIYLRAGVTYTGPIRLNKSVRLSTFGANVTGRVTPTESFAIVQAVNNEPAIDITGSNVTVDQLRIEGASGDLVLCGHADNTQTTLEQVPETIVLSRLVIDGTAGAKRGIGLHCRNAWVDRSYCYGIRRVGQDTQCIGGWNGPGGYVIEDNYLEAAGENIMFGGADPSIPGLVPTGILVDRNTIVKDLAWRGTTYTVKNLFELKAGIDVTVRRNIFGYNWAGQGQSGYAVQLTVQSQDGTNPNVQVGNVLFEQNTFTDIAAGFNLMGRPQIHPTVGLQTCGVTLRDNYLQIRSATYGGNGWTLSLSREPCDVTVEYNTFDSDTAGGLVYHQNAPVQGFIFTSNLVLRSGYGLSGWDGTTTQHRAVALDTYYPANVVTGNLFGSMTLVQATDASFRVDNTFAPSSTLTIDATGVGTGAAAGYGRRQQ